MNNYPEIQAVLDLFEDMGASDEALHHEKTMLMADEEYLLEQLEFYHISAVQLSTTELH